MFFVLLIFMAKTKKVGLSGRFGTRFGAQVRKEWRNIAEKQKGFQKCPRCETKIRNMREFVGVWYCKKCGATWTGGAWESVTDRGKESHRIASRISREILEAEKSK